MNNRATLSNQDERNSFKLDSIENYKLKTKTINADITVTEG